MTENVVNIDNITQFMIRFTKIYVIKFLWIVKTWYETLTLRSLASEFDTSVTPVRDSVRRLTAEGALNFQLRAV